MGLFLNKNNNKITPKGDLESNNIIDAIYELDRDLQDTRNMITGAQGATIISEIEPDNLEGIWIDLSE